MLAPGRDFALVSIDSIIRVAFSLVDILMRAEGNDTFAKSVRSREVFILIEPHDLITIVIRGVFVLDSLWGLC